MIDLAALNSDLQHVDARLVGLGPREGVQRGPRHTGAGVDFDVVVEDDWLSFHAPGASPAGAAPSRGARALAQRQRIRFEDLPGNDLHDRLRRFDDRLTPHRGLRRLTREGALEPLTAPLPGRGLLIVHGTFSNGDVFVEGLLRRAADFLGWAHGVYDHVLTYDYATTSQPAITSAMTLARLMRIFHPGAIDVISHSQGGLVTRYWLEGFDRGRLDATRAVFVAGTLAGTSLAAPAALRRTLDYLGNIGRVLRFGLSPSELGVPLFGAVALLLAVLEKSLHFLSQTPLLDAGVALVPGFVGMSRASTNAEMLELRRTVDACPPGYSAVVGDFEPTDPGWAFWRAWKLRLADRVAQRLFDGPHDLVVDTESQTSLSDSVAIERVHRFAAQGLVHHNNYFEQPATLQFIRAQLARS